jgi:hypothetical protein
MNIISRNLNTIGILLLMTFAAAAAGLYWDVPQRFQKSTPQEIAPAVAAEKTTVRHNHSESVAATAVPSGEHASCPMHASKTAAETADVPAESGCAHSHSGGCCSKPSANETTAAPASGCTRQLEASENSQ